ncbi:MAG: alpha-L-arabinofuranosidase [Acidobacteriia bacterium]|nr:alpha-L-arabinofuranosidase [Terriglobia bacterium]
MKINTEIFKINRALQTLNSLLRRAGIRRLPLTLSTVGFVIATIAAQLAAQQIVVTPSRTGKMIRPELFGAVLSFQDNGQGAEDYTKVGALVEIYNGQTFTNAGYATGIEAFYPQYVELLRKLRVTQIRFGDASPTATVYEWRRAIGPTVSRSPQRSRSGSPGIAPTYGPDEFGQLAEAVGAKGNWVYNIETGNAKDAANLLAYLTMTVPKNFSQNPDDPSYWAALRAANGHRAPYPIDYFDPGNEEEGASGWRAGTLVSIGSHTTTCVDVPACLYAFGGTTAFSNQAVEGYADLSSTSSLGLGTPGQQFYVKQPPVVPSSQTVYVSGVAWAAVSHLSSQGPTAQVYSLDNATGKITFGDGTNGAVPPVGSRITISYQSGPHDGYVQYYAALKTVNPRVKVPSEDSDPAFYQDMGTVYPYDGVANHPLGVGFPSTSLSTHEFELEEFQAPVTQASQEAALRQTMDTAAGENLPILLTAYGHSQGNQPAGDTNYHLRLIDGLVEANQLIQYQGIGVPLAHRFLLSDKPFNPNPVEAPPCPPLQRDDH